MPHTPGLHPGPLTTASCGFYFSSSAVSHCSAVKWPGPAWGPDLLCHFWSSLERWPLLYVRCDILQSDTSLEIRLPLQRSAQQVTATHKLSPVPRARRALTLCFLPGFLDCQFSFISPASDLLVLGARNYLYDRALWTSVCLEPSKAVVWHVAFFSTLLCISLLQLLLVAIHVINSILVLFCSFWEKC